MSLRVLFALALLAGCAPDDASEVPASESATLLRAATGESCSTPADDDNDGAANCADAECLAATGCTNCDDDDGDGYAACPGAVAGEDCDDTDEFVHPGGLGGPQPELRCNGVDDDCNGTTGDTPHLSDVSRSAPGDNIATIGNVCVATNEYWASCANDGDLKGDWVVSFTAPGTGVYRFSTDNPDLAMEVLRGACPTTSLGCSPSGGEQIVNLTAGEVVMVLFEARAGCTTEAGDLDVCRDDDLDGYCSDVDTDDTDARRCEDSDNDTCDDCTNGAPDPDDDGPDLDQDQDCDAHDPDIDGDGVDNGPDVADRDPDRCLDGDGDTCDDCSQVNPPDEFDDGPDSNGDGECDASPTSVDDDDDTVLDGDDRDPTDPNLCLDGDNDGCDDCAIEGIPNEDNDGTDSDGTGQCDLTDPDDDDDTVGDATDSVTTDPRRCRDVDADLCDDCALVNPPNERGDGVDFDNDGLCDFGDPDDDGDGAPDTTDPNDNDRSVCGDGDQDNCEDCAAGFYSLSQDGSDFDGDGKCDVGDPDIDGDGVDNAADPQDYNRRVCGDSDVDSCDDCDLAQQFAPANDGPDSDADGVCDVGDDDQDGDRVGFLDDRDDRNAFVCRDDDADGCDDCSVAGRKELGNDGPDFDVDGLCDGGDPDDDDDQVLDGPDPDDRNRYVCGSTAVLVTGDPDADGCDDCSLDGVANPANDGTDTDADRKCDAGDLDDDNDGVSDADDVADVDRFRCQDDDGDRCDDCSVQGTVATADDGPDQDADGICDLSDTDDDNDGAGDADDPVDDDPFVCGDSDRDGCDDCGIAGTKQPTNDGADLDQDGVCDTVDTDLDGDGVNNDVDPQPTNRFACKDEDLDGCDDCAVLGSPDPGDDGPDFDGDRKCDAGDLDDDADTVPDADDAVDLDPNQCLDRDGDGCDDCATAGTPDVANDGVDVDADGWCVAGDCDDDDATRFPGQLWLPDCDGDGAARPTGTVVACDPAGASLVPGACPAAAAGWALSTVDVALTDCDDADPTEFPGQVWYPDCDRDGVGAAAVTACDAAGADAATPCTDSQPPDGGFTHALPARLDCDDETADVSPLLPEACEPLGVPQVDTDCNGNVNTQGFGANEIPATIDIRRLFEDVDLDGFGDAAKPTDGCEVKPGLSISDTDCDDTRSDVFVGSPEVCDGADQNCNARIDEAEFLAETGALCTNLYRDRDGDGYGDGDSTQCLCAGTGEDAVFDGETYVPTFTDCDDLHADIRPHECNDGADNDGDSLVDGEDPDCAIAPGATRRPSSESGASGAVEERIDGHDNQCDGLVPLIELDCDDDGSFPTLPISAQTLFEASDVGLARCADGPIQVACWGETLTAECDEVTGLWGIRYNASEDGFGGRYQGGFRDLVDVGCDATEDCDDQCPTRCPGRAETCDGVDDDCSGVVVDADADGIPDPMDPAVAKGGTVAAAELDLDGDAHASCQEDFLEGAEQLQAEVATCLPFVAEFPTTDCDDLCYLANDLGVEACNDFVDVCGAAREARDQDGDGRSTCGASTAVAADLEEQAFVPVLLTGGSPSFVPLVPPRPRSTTCDGPLRDALADALDAVGATLGEDTTSADLVDQLCVTPEDCTVVVLRLVPDGADLLAAAQTAATAGSLPTECAEDAVELSLRTMWDHDRLAGARAGVVELECRRVFGKPCAEIGPLDPAVARGAPPDADGLLAIEGAPFWAEIGRYSPFTADGAVMGCWGDPRVVEPSLVTGGDCADGTGDANRDAPEGPDDLVAVWLGEAGDCSRCTDGVDNNCDGLSDCADPTCDVCFVGQGRGCAGLRDACAADDAGCTVAPPTTPVHPIFPALAFLVGLLRRRSRAARSA